MSYSSQRLPDLVKPEQFAILEKKKRESGAPARHPTSHSVCRPVAGSAANLSRLAVCLSAALDCNRWEVIDTMQLCDACHVSPR